jgi:hypothetical protein
VSDDPKADPGSSRRSRFGWTAAGLATLHAVVGLLLFEPTLFPGGDNAGYLILGDSLRTGSGYRDLYLPGSPLHARYPPLLPSLLALLGTLGGTHLAKIAMLACTSLAVWVTAILGRRLVGDGPALFAAALLAINPTLLEYGHYILSEAPFVLLVVLALWASQRDDRQGAVLATVAAVGAFATRTAGLTVLLALPLSWVARKSWRRAAWGGIVAISTLAIWGLYQRWAAPEQPGYLQELVLIDPYTPEAGSVGLTGLALRAAENLWAYASRVIPQTAIGTEGAATPLVAIFGLTLAGLALAGWAMRTRKPLDPPEIFVLLYVGLIAIWPQVWTDRRFLLPLLPMLTLLALGFVASRGDRARRWAPALLACAIALPCLVWVVKRVPARVECVAMYRAGQPCDIPAFASLYEAARWARDSTPPDAIIANRKPRLFYWYSRRQGDLYPFSTDEDIVLGGLERMGADFVVVDQVSGTTGRYLVPAIQARQHRFEPVYQGGSPPTFVFRMLPSSPVAVK